MSHEPTRTFDVNDVALRWDRWGEVTSSPVLALCHGFSGSSYDFSLHIDALATSRTVVALDHRGHGLSTKTHDASSYSIEQLTDDLVGFLDGAVDAPVDLLGHSMGGRIALGVVLRRPDLVHSLILMDTSAWSFEPADDKIRTMIETFLATYDPASGLPDPRLLRSPEDDLIEATVPEAWRTRDAEIKAGFDPYALKAIGVELFGSKGLSVRDRLGEIACPVTVLVGEHDHPLVDQAPQLASEVANGRAVVIEGAYHSPQLTHGDEWRAAVLDHLGRAAD